MIVILSLSYPLIEFFLLEPPNSLGWRIEPVIPKVVIKFCKPAAVPLVLDNKGILW